MIINQETYAEIDRQTCCKPQVYTFVKKTVTESNIEKMLEVLISFGVSLH